MRLLSLLALSLLAPPAAAAPSPEAARWAAQARRVTITRDDWGIAHVHGRSDADAVFGMIYAQAEDDWPRIERNYLVALGRLAEAEGESALWQDLRQRLFVDEADLRRRHAAAPARLRRLTQAWADGLNHYLATHPEVRPRVLTRFEAWMALSFSEGSIGGDIERIDLAALERFYTKPSPLQGRGLGEGAVAVTTPLAPVEPTGSNGIAIGHARSRSGHPLLLINPHTSFFFRSELQMRSDEGLNAYGAVTWGQFFIYQGFNDRAGWMHTTSGADAVDEFLETVVRQGSGYSYRYGTALRPLRPRKVTLRYRLPDGRLGTRAFTTWHTHRGPIVRSDGVRWVSTALMWKPVEALTQSFERTRARDLAAFLRVGRLRANSSNNTLYADRTGAIAYLHPQFLPKRDVRFDYAQPVDGADPATDWQGEHALAELPQVVSPRIGWVMNTNNWPFTAAGHESPRRADYPAYVDTFGENYRGLHALALLSRSGKLDLDGLVAAAYDPHLPAFERLLPDLLAAWDRLPAGPDKQRLSEPVGMLRSWDRRWSVTSEATTLAIFWGEALREAVAPAVRARGLSGNQAMLALETLPTPAERLAALDAAMKRLQHDFGRWRVPWGEINRFQRVSPAIDHPFSDAAPSIPVGFTSAAWGSLASFGARAYPGTRRWYGSVGNSFVAAVEFGPRVRARAVTAGGASGDPASPHFNDQAQAYAAGALRPVRFHPDEIRAHARLVYRPGERAAR